MDTVGISTKDRTLRAVLVTDCRVRAGRCKSRGLAIRLVHCKAGYSIPAKCEVIFLSMGSRGEARKLVRKKRGARKEQ